MCELLANGIGIRSFLYDVYALEYLIKYGRTSEIVLVNDDCSSTGGNDIK